jgi:anti-sigma B factor antagonist
MAFDVRASGEHAKIILSGDVDLQTTSELKNEITSITEAKTLEIDAASVTYIDSSGVAVLLLARQHCAQHNMNLVIPAVSMAVYRVLEIAKLDRMLSIGEVIDAGDTGVMGIGQSDDALASDLLGD